MLLTHDTGTTASAFEYIESTGNEQASGAARRGVVGRAGGLTLALGAHPEDPEETPLNTGFT